MVAFDPDEKDGNYLFEWHCVQEHETLSDPDTQEEPIKIPLEGSGNITWLLFTI